MGIGGVLGIAGGIMQSRSASKAADAQTAAANRQIDFQQGIYDDQKAMFAPWVSAGQNALGAYLYDMGLGAAPIIGGTAPEITTVTTGGDAIPVGALGYGSGAGYMTQRGGPSGLQAMMPQKTTPQKTQYMVGDNAFATMEEAQAYANANPVGGTAYGGYEASPGYQWQLEQGQKAIDGSAAARGNVFSSGTLDRQQQMGQGLAAQDYGNHLARLMGVSSMGQNSVAQQATAAQNLGTGVSNALGSIGNAQAAGAIGKGNALSDMMGNLGGWYGYQQGANGGNTASMFDAPWASSGFGW